MITIAAVTTNNNNNNNAVSHRLLFGIIPSKISRLRFVQ
jgi:hypothetical protein